MNLHMLPCLQLSQPLGYPAMRENVMKKKSLLKNWIVFIPIIILSQLLYVLCSEVCEFTTGFVIAVVYIIWRVEK